MHTSCQPRAQSLIASITLLQGIMFRPLTKCILSNPPPPRPFLSWKTSRQQYQQQQGLGLEYIRVLDPSSSRDSKTQTTHLPTSSSFLLLSFHSLDTAKHKITSNGQLRSQVMVHVPSLEVAHASVFENPSFASNFQALASKHGQNNTYGLALVHRHAEVSPGHRLMDFKQTLQPFPLNDTVEAYKRVYSVSCIV